MQDSGDCQSKERKPKEGSSFLKGRETTVMLEGLAAVGHTEVLGDLQINNVRAVQRQSTKFGVSSFVLALEHFFCLEKKKIQNPNFFFFY